MSIAKVDGSVNGKEVIFYGQTQDNYEADTDANGAEYNISVTATDDHGNVSQIREKHYLKGMWIPPVWQRTQADVDYVKYLNSKIGQGGWESLSLKEQSDWAAGLIGCLNYWDLSRIEFDTKYLADQMNLYGYTVTVQPYADAEWIMSDFPYAHEMERIRLNVQALIDAYYPQEVPLPATLEKPNYIVINDLENNLKLLKEMIDRMIDGFLYAGTFESGEEVSL